MILAKYGTALTLDGIPLITKGAMDYKANPTLAAGDVKVSKDGGASANITTLPLTAPIGETLVRVSLSAIEMQAKMIVVTFIDQTSPKEWEDQRLIIYTHGNASAYFTGNFDNLDAAISAVPLGAVTVGTNNDKTGYALSVAGVDSILDDAVEGTLTLRQVMKVLLSVLAGKSSGGGTATITFRDNADLKARVTATVDSNGNRTGITIDGA